MFYHQLSLIFLLLRIWLRVVFFRMQHQLRFVAIGFLAHRARKNDTLVDELVRSACVRALESLRTVPAHKRLLVGMHSAMVLQPFSDGWKQNRLEMMYRLLIFA